MDAPLVNLDAAATFEHGDPEHFCNLLAGYPRQARDAWEAASVWPLPTNWRTPRRVLILGMGGSASGASFIDQLARATSAVPVQVVRDYQAPPADDGTLVIASSYSGNTEETLSAFAATLDSGAMHLAITTGGRLAAACEEHGAPVFSYRWNGPPRTAFCTGVFVPLAILARLGVLPLATAEAEAALDAIETATAAWGVEQPAAENLAKRLAQRLHGATPVVLGGGWLEAAAMRWATQINENAKEWAFAGGMPEANHNMVVALDGEARAPVAAVLLDHPALHARTRRRIALTAALLGEAGIPTEVVEAGGDPPLGAMLRAAILGDWASYYLALLRGLNPMPIAAIDRLKAALDGSPDR